MKKPMDILYGIYITALIIMTASALIIFGYRWGYKIGEKQGNNLDVDGEVTFNHTLPDKNVLKKTIKTRDLLKWLKIEDYDWDSVRPQVYPVTEGKGEATNAFGLQAEVDMASGTDKHVENVIDI